MGGGGVGVGGADGLLAGVVQHGYRVRESILGGGIGAWLELTDADADIPKNKFPDVSPSASLLPGDVPKPSCHFLWP